MKKEKMRVSYNYLEQLRDTYKTVSAIANDKNIAEDTRQMARETLETLKKEGMKEKQEIKELKEDLR